MKRRRRSIRKRNRQRLAAHARRLRRQQERGAGSGPRRPFQEARRFKSAGFSLAFAIRGKLWTGRFKSVLLDAGNSAGNANLADHRCSNLR